jgi:glycosyltransferase involved in cell wall biosynthesis
MRASQASVEVGYEPTVFAVYETGLLETEKNQQVNVRRFRLHTRYWPKIRIIQLIKYLEAAIRMIKAGWDLHPDLIHANDIMGLPIGYVIALTTKARLVYDSHELWSDASMNQLLPNWILNISLMAERILAQKADAVIAVSDGIADEMKKNLKIERPLVVRNIPNAKVLNDNKITETPLRRALGISAEIPIILYEGALLPGRGLLTLIEAMAQVSHPSALLVMLGDGPLLINLHDQAESLGIKDKVYFHPAVPQTYLYQWTQDATLGVSPIESLCLSYNLCLPNKLFEYIQAELPVLVTDLPEMKRLVNHYGLGEVFPDGDASTLAKKIDLMLMDASLIDRYRNAAKNAARELNWDIEKKQLFMAYDRG